MKNLKPLILYGKYCDDPISEYEFQVLKDTDNKYVIFVKIKSGGWTSYRHLHADLSIPQQRLREKSVYDTKREARLVLADYLKKEWIPTFGGLPYPDSIEQAAHYLDYLFPYWEQAVEIANLNFADGDCCILGQLSSSFYKGIALFSENRLDDEIFGIKGNKSLWEKEILGRLQSNCTQVERKNLLHLKFDTVKKAASYLDSVVGDWYNHIDESTLNLGDSSFCILGQIYNAKSSEYPNRYAFQESIKLSPYDGIFSFDRYKDEWIREINSRKQSHFDPSPVISTKSDVHVVGFVLRLPAVELDSTRPEGMERLNCLIKALTKFKELCNG